MNERKNKLKKLKNKQLSLTQLETNKSPNKQNGTKSIARLVVAPLINSFPPFANWAILLVYNIFYFIFLNSKKIILFYT
jgi:hypothetical protein